jgi:hypothetical protein
MSTLYTATTVAYYLIPALLLREGRVLCVPFSGSIRRLPSGYLAYNLRGEHAFTSHLAALWHLCREVR